MYALDLTGFNRTFMELKRAYDKLIPLATECFNRTFMELKPPTYARPFEIGMF